MRQQRRAIRPGLQEHEPERILGVAMDRMRQTAGLRARAPDVGEAQRQQLVDRAGRRHDAAGDHDHAKLPGFCGSPSRISNHGAFEATYPWTAGRTLGSPSRVPARTETMSFVASAWL